MTPTNIIFTDKTGTEHPFDTPLSEVNPAVAHEMLNTEVKKHMDNHGIEGPYEVNEWTQNGITGILKEPRNKDLSIEEL